MKRQRFIWWPFHPIGYAIAGTATMEWLWCALPLLRHLLEFLRNASRCVLCTAELLRSRLESSRAEVRSRRFGLQFLSCAGRLPMPRGVRTGPDFASPDRCGRCCVSRARGP